MLRHFKSMAWAADSTTSLLARPACNIHSAKCMIPVKSRVAWTISLYLVNCKLAVRIWNYLLRLYPLQLKWGLFGAFCLITTKTCASLRFPRSFFLLMKLLYIYLQPPFNTWDKLSNLCSHLAFVLRTKNRYYLFQSSKELFDALLLWPFYPLAFEGFKRTDLIL